MDRPTTLVAFAGARRVALGPLGEVLSVLKRRFDTDSSESVLVFDTETGAQVDFDLRGSLEDVVARAAPPQPTGPGRPRLGVVSREVSLLPRHWAWLEGQPNGISAALRRLVDEARKTECGEARARRLRAALSRLLTAMAGDRPHFEEATRALFAGDVQHFEQLVQRWPKDIRAYAVERSREASRVAAEPA